MTPVWVLASKDTPRPQDVLDALVPTGLDARLAPEPLPAEGVVVLLDGPGLDALEQLPLLHRPALRPAVVVVEQTAAAARVKALVGMGAHTVVPRGFVDALLGPAVLAASQHAIPRGDVEGALRAGVVSVWGAFVGLDESGSLTQVRLWTSPVLREALGVTPQEFPDGMEAWLERIHPQDERRVMDALDAHFRADAPYDITYRLRRGDGSYAWFHTTARSTRTPQGLHMLGTTQDVTREHTAQDDAVERQQRFLSLLGQTTLGAVHVVGNNVLPNDAACRAVGVSPQDVPTLDAWFSAVYGSGAQDARTAYQEELAAGGGKPRLTSVVRKDGTKRVLEWQVAGDAGEAIWLLRDITENTQEAALYRTLAGSIPNAAVALFDRNRRLLLADGPVLSRLGLQKDNLLHRPAAVVFPSSMTAALQTAMLAALEGSPSTFTQTHQERLFELATVPVRSATGEVMGGLLLAQDVTERQHLQQRLFISERMATVGTLAAGVTHEINNPLAYVTGNLHFLEDDLKALAERIPNGMAPTLVVAMVEDMLASVRDALHGTTQVSAIVQDLKVFSRAETDGAGPSDVTRVVHGAVKLAGTELRHRANVQLELGPVPLVRGSEGRLSQVVLNLLINAAHAIPEGHPERHKVTVRSRVLPDGNVELSVADTGVGMPPDVLARVFEPFFTTKAVGEGSGLGLSICHGIIQGLGGSITAHSTPGKGATFVVVLPAHQPAASQVRARTPAPTRSHGRILLIDDDPRVGLALQRMLGSSYQVEIQLGASAALSRLRDGERYDLVLCDLIMPGLSGMDFHDELKKTHPELLHRVAFMTGGAFTEKARAFLRDTDLPRVEKPFDRARFERLLEEVRARG